MLSLRQGDRQCQASDTRTDMHGLVAVEDNYDRLGYAPADIVRDAR